MIKLSRRYEAEQFPPEQFLQPLELPKPRGLDIIIGHEKIENVVRRALRSDQSINLLFIDGYASAVPVSPLYAYRFMLHAHSFLSLVRSSESEKIALEIRRRIRIYVTLILPDSMKFKS